MIVPLTSTWLLWSFADSTLIWMALTGAGLWQLIQGLNIRLDITGNIVPTAFSGSCPPGRTGILVVLSVQHLLIILTSCTTPSHHPLCKTFSLLPCSGHLSALSFQQSGAPGGAAHAGITSHSECTSQWISASWGVTLSQQDTCPSPSVERPTSERSTLAV